MSATASKSTSPSPAASTAKDQRLRWLLIGAGILLVLATAIVQGFWSDRWTDAAADSLHFKRRIDSLPLTLGDWEGKDLEADPREIRASGAVGHLSRVYRNRVTGEQVSLFLICGHMRDVSVHTPDRCYPAAGFDQLSAPERFTIGTSAGPVETFTTTFRQEAAEGIVTQRVFWTWGLDDKWEAPENPRVYYGGVRALYKMYLISSVPPGVQQEAEDSPCLTFAQDTMSLINETLFQPLAEKEPEQTDATE